MKEKTILITITFFVVFSFYLFSAQRSTVLAQSCGSVTCRTTVMTTTPSDCNCTGTNDCRNTPNPKPCSTTTQQTGSFQLNCVYYASMNQCAYTNADNGTTTCSGGCASSGGGSGELPPAQPPPPPPPGLVCAPNAVWSDGSCCQACNAAGTGNSCTDPSYCGGSGGGGGIAPADCSINLTAPGMTKFGTGKNSFKSLAVSPGATVPITVDGGLSRDIGRKRQTISVGGAMRFGNTWSDTTSQKFSFGQSYDVTATSSAYATGGISARLCRWDDTMTYCSLFKNCTDSISITVGTAPPPPATPTVNSWLQLVGGHLLTNGRISIDLPDGAFLIEKLNEYAGVVVHRLNPLYLWGGFASQDPFNWDVQDAPPINFRTASRPFPASFYERYRHQVNYDEKLQEITASWKPRNPGNYSYGTAALTNMQITEPWHIASGEKYIIFVPGTLTINQRITVDEGGFLFFAAKEGIIINDSVGNPPTASPNGDIEGIYITDGTFDTGMGNKQLIIEGTVVAKELKQDRDLGDDNATFPAVQFILRPDFQFSLPETLKRQRRLWREIAP